MPGVRAVLAAAAAFGLVATHAAAQAPPAGGASPTIEQAAISPDGRLLAVDLVKGDQRTIVVQDLAAGKIVTGVKIGPTRLRSLSWAGDGHLILLVAVTGKFFGVMSNVSQLTVATDFDLSRQKLTQLLGDIDKTENTIYNGPFVRMEGGKPVLYAVGGYFPTNGLSMAAQSGGLNVIASRRALFKIDLSTDRSTMVVQGDETATDFVIDADGRPLAQSEYNPISKQWSLSLLRNGAWHTVQTRQGGAERPRLLGLGRDGQSILIGEQVNGQYEVRELSLDGATFSDPLPGPQGDDVLRDSATHRLIGMAAPNGDTVAYHFYDPADQLKWDAVAAAFPNMRVALASWSDDHRMIVLRVNSPAQGPGYALVDLAHGATSWLGSAAPPPAPPSR